MAKYKVVIQKAAPGASNYDAPYTIESEALDPIGAEIVEVAAKTEEEFIAAAQDADAIIARNRRISATIIKSLKKCKVIGLSSVGADTVDVDAATEAGIVVTNVPDVFIDEVADHTMAMFLAAHRRLDLHLGYRLGEVGLEDLERVAGLTGVAMPGAVEIVPVVGGLSGVQRDRMSEHARARRRVLLPGRVRHARRARPRRGRGWDSTRYRQMR